MSAKLCNSCSLWGFSTALFAQREVDSRIKEREGNSVNCVVVWKHSMCINNRAMPHTSVQPVVELRRSYSASHAETTASLVISLVISNNELQFITAHSEQM